MSRHTSPKNMDGTGKWLVEHGRHHSQQFQPNVKRAKFDGPILDCNGSKIPSGAKAKADNNVVSSAKPLRILTLNQTRTKHTKPVVSCVKAASLKQKMTQKNVKTAGKEDKTTCLAAIGTTQDCNKGKTASQRISFANGRPPSYLSKRVSVSEEIRKGTVGLDESKSVIFVGGSSPVGPKSPIVMVKTHYELIEDDICCCSLTERKVQTNASTENRVISQNKLTQFIRDGTCTVAQKKFALVDVSNAKSAREVKVSGCRVSKLNSRAELSSFPQSNSMCFVAHDECSEVVSRKEVLKSVDLFEEVYTKLLQERKRVRNERGKATNRIDIRAAMILKEEGKWVNTDQAVGEVPGLEIGDQFQYRAELAVVGLHGSFYAGIDYIKVGEKLYATCIVDSGRYSNERKTPDEFIYTGEGGNPKLTRKKPEDQKLRRGNLALKTSMDAKLPVRVIHCRQSLKAPNTLGMSNGGGLRYTYDGLYTASSFWKERDECGKLVFKFKMIRMPNQSYLAPQILRVEEMHGKVAGTCPSKEKKLIHSLNATTKGKESHCAYNSVLDCCSS